MWKKYERKELNERQLPFATIVITVIISCKKSLHLFHSQFLYLSRPQNIADFQLSTIYFVYLDLFHV